MDLLVNERKAAECLGLAVQTLRNYRSLGRGPKYVKLGRAVRYRMEDLESFIEAHLVIPRRSRSYESEDIEELLAD